MSNESELKMKVEIALSLAAHLLMGSIASAADVDLAAIQKLVSGYMTSTGASGVAISLVQSGAHKELYFGRTGRGKDTLVTAQTLFEIGSITKVFTPHLMILAQEEGKIDPRSRFQTSPCIEKQSRI